MASKAVNLGKQLRVIDKHSTNLNLDLIKLTELFSFKTGQRGREGVQMFILGLNDLAL